MDYFSLLSHIFVLLGYNVWTILFDEAKLIGRLGKKTRMKAYNNNMANFLFPEKRLQSTFSMFAISSSYHEDVIEGKHEIATLKELYSEEEGKPISKVLKSITSAHQLAPLDNEEIHEILLKLIRFHGRAYNWSPKVDINVL